ncbi:MAG: MoaD/ThiS family protein [Nitrososphaerales archaeon]
MSPGSAPHRLHVRYLGIIQRIVGASEEEMAVMEGTRVRDLLQILKGKYGTEMKSALEDNHLLASNAIVLVDGKNTDTMKGLDTLLEKGQDVQIVVMAPSGFGG